MPAIPNKIISVNLIIVFIFTSLFITLDRLLKAIKKLLRTKLILAFFIIHSFFIVHL